MCKILKKPNPQNYTIMQIYTVESSSHEKGKRSLMRDTSARFTAEERTDNTKELSL